MLSNSEVKTLLICVNYYTYDDVYALIESIKQQIKHYTIKVVIVNNNEQDRDNSQSSELLLKYADDELIDVYNTESNLGYFGAANWALKTFLKHNLMPDWIIVANADMEVNDKLFFNKLYLSYPEGFHSVIAPSIYSSLTGLDQNPKICKRPSSNKMLFYKWIFKYYYIYVIYECLSLIKSRLLKVSKLICNSSIKNNIIDDEKLIYAPHGPFIIFHKSYFNGGGTIEYGVFLFGEEIYVAESVRLLGQNVIYDQNLKVIHKDHATTKIIKNKRLVRYMYTANNYLADKFFGK